MMHKTKLFQAIPRNYWKDLEDACLELGAVSREHNIETARRDYYGVSLDTPNISCSFIWSKAPQGHEFWSKLHTHLCSLEHPR